MSAVVQAVSSAVQAAAPAAPVVVTKTVEVTPEPVIQLFQVLAVIAAAWVTSVVHQLIDKGRFSEGVNRLLVTLYSSGAAVGYDLLTGNLHLSAQGAVATLTAFLVALGTAMGRYELSQALNKVSAAPAAEDSALSTLPVATDA